MNLNRVRLGLKGGVPYYEDPKYIAWMNHLGVLGIDDPNVMPDDVRVWLRLYDSDSRDLDRLQTCSLNSLVAAVYLKEHMPWEWDKFETLYRLGVR